MATLHAFFASPVCLDVVRLVTLAMALWSCTRKLVSLREDDVLASASLDQTVMYCLSYRRWPRVFALNNVLACRLLECPHNGLRGRRHEIGNGDDAIAVDGYHDEMVLLFSLLRDGEAKNLVDVLPRNRKFDGAIGAHRTNTAVLFIK